METTTKPATGRIWMITTIALFVILVAYIVMNPPGSKGSAAAEETVAKINDVSISKTQLYDAMLAGGGVQTLDSLISQELIRQEGTKAGIQVTEADLEQEMQTVRSSFASEEEFQQALATYGMTEESLKKEMNTQVQLRKLLEPQVTVTDEEIKKYYDENLEMLKTPEQVKASHILVATKEEADAILAQVKNGSDFAALAQEKSLDEGSKANGGDLGYFGRGEMEEAFETAAFAGEPGSLSDVVQTTHGYHVIKVTDKKAAQTPTLEEKKEDIRKQLVDTQISTITSTWMQEKRSQAKIENYLDTAI